MLEIYLDSTSPKSSIRTDLSAFLHKLSPTRTNSRWGLDITYSYHGLVNERFDDQQSSTRLLFARCICALLSPKSLHVKAKTTLANLIRYVTRDNAEWYNGCFQCYQVLFYKTTVDSVTILNGSNIKWNQNQKWKYPNFYIFYFFLT